MIRHLILRLKYIIANPKFSRTSWRRIRTLVRKRDKGKCVYCDKLVDKDGHCDHVLALSDGGTDSIDNLVWACRECNLEKGAYTLRDWVIKMLAEKHLSKEQRHRYIRLINYPSGLLGWLQWIGDCPLFR